MRLVLGLLAVLFVPSVLSAQEPSVVRGCVSVDTGVMLRPVSPEFQHFDSNNRYDSDGVFILFADNDLLDEIALHEGDEIEVTGHINPPGPEPSVQPPILQPPGGNLPGVGRPGNPRGLIELRSNVLPIENVIVVQKFKAVRPGCRARSRF